MEELSGFRLFLLWAVVVVPWLASFYAICSNINPDMGE